MFALDPLTRKKLAKFRSIRRGYWSFLLFCGLLLISLGAELLVNNRAILVRHDGQWYFPTYGANLPGKTFGLDYDYETNYRELKAKVAGEGRGDFVILPIVPYGPYETEYRDGQYPPFAPSLSDRHVLGTDTAGRDIAARLLYGFRIAIAFSLVLILFEYLIGMGIGCLMGWWGGRFDLLVQRLIEVWTNIPFLYVVIIVSSIMVPTFGSLVAIMVFFGWVNMTWVMRTITYQEKVREYVAAARVLGAPVHRIITHEILPNAVSTIVTRLPFSVSAGIVALTSLDYLGFGLPPPTPSWGDLLAQGCANLEQVWIVGSVIIAMAVVLTMVTFIGEAIREAFDPKRFTIYE